MSNIQRHGEKNWVTQSLGTTNTGFVPADPCSSIPICWTPLPRRAVKALVVIWMISGRFWQLAVAVERYVNLPGKGSEFRGQMFVICMYWLQRTYLGSTPEAAAFHCKKSLFFPPQIHPMDCYRRKCGTALQRNCCGNRFTSLRFSFFTCKMGPMLLKAFCKVFGLSSAQVIRFGFLINDCEKEQGAWTPAWNK